VLGILALTLVLSAFAAGYVRHRSEGQVGPQPEPPSPQLSTSELADYRAAANTPAGVAAAPIVLAYHDIVAVPDDRYDVARQDFARHMAMLHAAGYRTLTGDEFVAVLHGKPAPPRSVLITFDDGTQGLWTYADRILERYGFHAVALVITGHLDDRAGPYYLSWPEVVRMAASGRWTFGSHTRDSHREIPVSPAARSGAAIRKSELVNRRWTSTGRESLWDFRRRVDADLRGSIQDLTGHGLPRPRLFAYPFSEASLPGQDPAALRYVLGRVSALFGGAFSSFTSAPEPVGVRALARDPLIIDRLAVNGSVSARDLFVAMRRMRTLPVSRADPLGRDALWLAPDGRPAPLRAGHSGLSFGDGFGGGARYLAARYATQATGDWTGYRVSATVAGLRGPVSVSGSLLAGAGGSRPVEVRVSAGQLRISRGRSTVAARLDRAAAHTVTIEMSGRRTTVTVDGVVRFSDRSVNSALSRGGIGVSAFRADTHAAFPVFEKLQVSPLEPS
jgi:peptidoglycan/xylan/chitin deacetylase (PgdA/CDA1 family)